MSTQHRVVIDTNVVVSALFFPASIPGKALSMAQKHTLLASEATLLELIAVTERVKWDRYVERTVRNELIAEFVSACKIIPITSSIRASRGPRDDKFLELAVNGRAGVLVTGDQDLLILHPFREIHIFTPAQYLDPARESS